jgi:hypothetical protein
MDEKNIEKFEREAMKSYSALLFIIFIIKGLILLGLVLVGAIKGILGLFKKFL